MNLSDTVFKKIAQKGLLDAQDIISLLSIDVNSSDLYQLLYYANHYSRNTFNGKGYVFAQIGINAQPCSVNCHFCSMGCGHYSIDTEFKKRKEDVVKEASQVLSEGISDLFLMTTADYPVSEFIEIGKAVKGLMSEQQRLVANIGDFTAAQAVELKEAGFTGVYHIVRLGEEQFTSATEAARVQSLTAARAAGLELYYCVEPIGPEHTPQEIAKEILRAQELKIDVMAVMRRVGVKGTPFENKGMISNRELTKIAAVTLLAVRPQRSMNVHETTELSIFAGINQLYGEYGANPRDLTGETSHNRGLTIASAKKILTDAGWII